MRAVRAGPQLQSSQEGQSAAGKGAGGKEAFG